MLGHRLCRISARVYMHTYMLCGGGGGLEGRGGGGGEGEGERDEVGGGFGGWAGRCERGCMGVGVGVGLLVCRPRSVSTPHPPSSVAHKVGKDSSLPAIVKHLYHEL